MTVPPSSLQIRAFRESRLARAMAEYFPARLYPPPGPPLPADQRYIFG